jgi:hypothetical protein
MDRITAIFPRPHPVPLGGRVYLVGELTLAQLADLQAFEDRRWPDPLEGVRDRLGAMDPESRRAALVAAYDVAEGGPPAWRGPADDEGLRHFLATVLKAHNPGLTGADVDHAFAEATAAEYAALCRASHGVTPLDEVEELLGVHRRDPGEPIGWSRAVVELMEAYPALTIEAVGGLTISQVRALRTGGKAEVRGLPVSPGRGLKEMLARSRAKFHGPESGKGAG